ncbi:MAG: A24 family peptidase [Terriglobales bacterium]
MRGGACLAAAMMLQSGLGLRSGAGMQFGPQFGPWIPAVLLAIVAGILDWRYRRIPNWLTVSGMAAGVVINTILYRWPGLKTALLGALLGLGVLLPFVLVRSLGAGDWKLAGALGACLGPRQLMSVLVGTILVAGVMALALVIWKGRLTRTLRNMAHLLAALFSLRMPGSEVSLDDPQSTKIPFGVAMALAVLFYGAGRMLGKI